jgi:hypothetical protein
MFSPWSTGSIAARKLKKIKIVRRYEKSAFANSLTGSSYRVQGRLRIRMPRRDLSLQIALQGTFPAKPTLNPTLCRAQEADHKQCQAGGQQSGYFSGRAG